ncbi:MAG: DinB family protein, partial [Dehalococcoidia bacterium]
KLGAGKLAAVAQSNAQQRVLWQALLHVANHSTHHRAETATLLTTLGHPPRQLDYIFFELERAGAPPRLT